MYEIVPTTKSSLLHIQKENWKWHFSLHPYDASTVLEQGTELWGSTAIFWTLTHKTAPLETTFWSGFHVSSEGLKQEGKLGLSKGLIIDVVKGLESDLQRICDLQLLVVSDEWLCLTTSAHIKVDFLVSVLTFESLVYPELPFRYDFRSKLIALPWTICCEMCVPSHRMVLAPLLRVNCHEHLALFYPTDLYACVLVSAPHHLYCGSFAKSWIKKFGPPSFFSGYSGSLAFPLNFRMHLSFLEKKKTAAGLAFWCILRGICLMRLKGWHYV